MSTVEDRLNYLNKNVKTDAERIVKYLLAYPKDLEEYEHFGSVTAFTNYLLTRANTFSKLDKLP